MGCWSRRRAWALALALVLALPLSGCRESTVLQEVVYTQTAPETDQDQETLSPEDQGRESQDFENETRDDADTHRDAKADQGLSDPDGTAAEALDSAYNPNAGNDWSAADDAGQSAVGQEAETQAGGSGTARQVADAAGRTVELPENVDTAAAMGAAAQMVEMVGGSGRLLGADQTLLSSSLAQAAFSDSASVAVWWDSAGTLSDSAFAALLAAAPGVCFEISGTGAFTEAQVLRLEQNGIPYVVLPALDSKEHLEQAVELVAQVLGTGRDGGSAADIAKAYSAWVEETVSAVSTATSGDLTSLYITAWDDQAVYSLNNTRGALDSQGSGLAVAYSPAASQLVTTFMAAAHVTNESTRLRSAHRDAARVYVAPMFHQFEPEVTGTQAVYYSGAGEYGSAYDLFVARMVSDSAYVQLGSTQYPAVIAADQTVKERLESNWFWQYHTADANGYVTVNGQSFYCGVVGEYEIYVNPQGMWDWAEGSVESPLEAWWIACVLQGECTMEEVRSRTAAFYETFFSVTLTEEQLTAIFGG